MGLVNLRLPVMDAVREMYRLYHDAQHMIPAAVQPVGGVFHARNMEYGMFSRIVKTGRRPVAIMMVRYSRGGVPQPGVFLHHPLRRMVAVRVGAMRMKLYLVLMVAKIVGRL